jgi:hypothetical protein
MPLSPHATSQAKCLAKSTTITEDFIQVASLIQAIIEHCDDNFALSLKPELMSCGIQLIEKLQQAELQATNLNNLSLALVEFEQQYHAWFAQLVQLPKTNFAQLTTLDKKLKTQLLWLKVSQDLTPLLNNFFNQPDYSTSKYQNIIKSPNELAIDGIFNLIKFLENYPKNYTKQNIDYANAWKVTLELFLNTFVMYEELNVEFSQLKKMLNPQNSLTEFQQQIQKLSGPARVAEINRYLHFIQHTLNLQIKVLENFYFHLLPHEGKEICFMLVSNFYQDATNMLKNFYLSRSQLNCLNLVLLQINDFYLKYRGQYNNLDFQKNALDALADQADSYFIENDIFFSKVKNFSINLQGNVLKLKELNKDKKVKNKKKKNTKTSRIEKIKCFINESLTQQLETNPEQLQCSKNQLTLFEIYNLSLNQLFKLIQGIDFILSPKPKIVAPSEELALPAAPDHPDQSIVNQAMANLSLSTNTQLTPSLHLASTSSLESASTSSLESASTSTLESISTSTSTSTLESISTSTSTSTATSASEPEAETASESEAETKAEKMLFLNPNPKSSTLLSPNKDKPDSTRAPLAKVIPPIPTPVPQPMPFKRLPIHCDPDHSYQSLQFYNLTKNGLATKTHVAADWKALYKISDENNIERFKRFFNQPKVVAKQGQAGFKMITGPNAPFKPYYEIKILNKFQGDMRILPSRPIIDPLEGATYLIFNRCNKHSHR